jgi:hypothetical protein
MSIHKVSVRPLHLARRVAVELGPKSQNIYKKNIYIFLKVFSVHITVKSFPVQFLSPKRDIEDE